MRQTEGSCCLCGLARPNLTLPLLCTFIQGPSLSTPPEESKPVTHVTRKSTAFPVNLRSKSEVMVDRRGSGSLQRFTARDDSHSSYGMFCLWCRRKGLSQRRKVLLSLEGCAQSTALVSCTATTGKGKGHPSPLCSSHLPSRDFYHQCVH